MHQSAFSPESLTPKKVRTKEPLSHSKSIKSAFVLFLYYIYFGNLLFFIFFIVVKSVRLPALKKMAFLSQGKSLKYKFYVSYFILIWIQSCS